MVERAVVPQQDGAASPKPKSPADAEGQQAEILPRQFGKYALLRRLAAGGMAEIFLALHRSVAGFEKLIVIKRILPSMNTHPAFIDMLLREARLAATLSHPNVVQTFDVGQVDGTYFIAMEHIHGEDIQGIVKAMKKLGLNEFPLEHTLSIVLGVCAGLAYAHDKRDLDNRPLAIVHRDISPRNIVVSFTGDVKIVDFGIAKSGVDDAEDENPGQRKGKAPYMSPEQASGQPIDWRSDIFATGVMLFELTTGKRLFKGASELETLKLIVDKEYPRPSEVKPGYPLGLERVVMRALAKDREARYQSARDMQAAIEAFVREERVAVSTVSLTAWMQYLFEDKLAQQKETLQDIKQLADVIAAQQGALYDGVTSTSTVGTTTASPNPPPPARTNAAPIAAVVVALALVFGAIFYVKHEDGLREAKPREGASADGAAFRADLALTGAEPDKTLAAEMKTGIPPGPAGLPPKDEKAAAAAGAPAKVRVGAKGGFCTVSVNGTSYGPTPVETVVPSGTVQVSCKPANGPSQQQSVTVAPGDTARVSFKIEE